MKHNTMKDYFKNLGFLKKIIKTIKMKQHRKQLQHSYTLFIESENVLFKWNFYCFD